MALCLSSQALSETSLANILYHNQSDSITRATANKPIAWSTKVVGVIGGKTAPTSASETELTYATGVTVSRANLYLDTLVNPWVSAHVALSLQDLSALPNGQESLGNAENFSYESSQQPSTVFNVPLQMLSKQGGLFYVNDSNTFRTYKPLDEAHITVGNLSRHPAYLQMGIGRIDFGCFDKDAVVANWTALFAETQAAFVKLGFIDASGFFGSIYAFNSFPQYSKYAFVPENIREIGVAAGSINLQIDAYYKINNGGATFGYALERGHISLRASAAYMHDLFGSNLFQSMYGGIQYRRSYIAGIENITSRTISDLASMTYKLYDSIQKTALDRMSGLHGSLNLSYKQFDMQINAITTVKKIMRNQTVLFVNDTHPVIASVDFGMNTKLGSRDIRLAAGAQMTHGLQEAISLIFTQNQRTASVSNLLHNIINEYKLQGSATIVLAKGLSASLHYIAEIPYKGTLGQGRDQRARVIHKGFLSLTANAG